MSVLAPVRDYIDALVHPSARHDAMTAARHRSFISSRMVMGLTALAMSPIYLVFNGVFGSLEAFFFGWMLLPILNGYFLSYTGRYELSHVLAALSLAILATVVAARTGGLASFAASWLVIVPLEAALSASRRAVLASAVLALSAACLLALGAGMGVSAEGDRTVLPLIGTASAVLYGTVIALRAGYLVAIGSRLIGIGEARYQFLARNITEAITRHSENGAVLFAAPTAEQLFGVPARELLGHGLFDRVHVGDRPAYLTALSDAAALGEARAVEFRVRREHPDRTRRQTPSFIWVEMRCRPLDDIAGEGTADEQRGAIAIMRDITERKHHGQEITAARDKAERANAAKGRFLATMTHELRTPLNAIIGFSDMLMNESVAKVEAARRKDYAKLINESGLHLLSVVNGILDMSKLESGNLELALEPFAPAPVIKACCDMLALKARDAGLDVVTRIGGLPEIRADRRALKQILLNLLSNAIKFTDRGGRVSVGARPEGAMLIIVVKDNGVGISASDLARVGDPFFQARDSYARPHGGTGLGLSIVKALVALHSGTMDIRSRVGEGTSVTVRLPIDGERAGRTNAGAKIRPRITSMTGSDTQARKRA